MPMNEKLVERVFPNCDAWGAAEWFERLANAVMEQDKAVVADDSLRAATYRGIAASSAMELVRGYRTEIRKGLDAAQALTLAQARIRELEKRADHYGVALMMIRAGCSDPARFAGNILDDKQPIDIDIEDELP